MPTTPDTCTRCGERPAAALVSSPSGGPHRYCGPCIIEYMAAAMRTKLEANLHKLHWSRPEVTDAYLLGRLLEEVDELRSAILAGSPTLEVWQEAADVANFAAMLADRLWIAIAVLALTGAIGMALPQPPTTTQRFAAAFRPTLEAVPIEVIMASISYHAAEAEAAIRALGMTIEEAGAAIRSWAAQLEEEVQLEEESTR